MKIRELICVFCVCFNVLIMTSQSPIKCNIVDTSVTFSGPLKGIEMSHCNNDIEITNLNENTEVKGRIEIKEGRKITIKPRGEYKIRIVAIKKAGEPKPGDRTKIGTKGKDNKPRNKLQNEIIIFPNPVKSRLTVEIQEIITKYKIVDMYGVIHLKESELDDNTIDTKELSKGLYNLIIQTKTQIITKTFYKN